MVVENRRPEEPESLFGIDVKDGIAIGKVGGVGEEERFAPSIGVFRFAGAEDRHIVGGAFARTTIPTGEQIAVRAFDDAGRMIVLGMPRENQIGLEARIFGDSGKEESESNVHGWNLRSAAQLVVAVEHRYMKFGVWRREISSACAARKTRLRQPPKSVSVHFDH